MDEWHSIKDLTLRQIGHQIDVQDDKRLYSCITMSGLICEYDMVDERFMDGSRNTVTLGRPSTFQIQHMQGTIDVNVHTTWREHLGS